MGTFLSVVLGVVVGIVILAMLGWWWLKRKLGKLGDALVDIAKALGGDVPPFRISLEPMGSAPFDDEKDLARLDSGLTGLGYEACGDYCVPEMDDVILRGYCHRTDGCMAVVYQHPQMDGLLLDINRANLDHVVVLATNTPATGLDEPPKKIVKRTTGTPDPVEMHNTVLAASEGHRAVPLTPKLFALMFTTAYAAEMDWRIERGGVTPKEVKGAALAGGQDEPDDDAVQIVMGHWRNAIAEFVGEQILDAYKASGQMSGDKLKTMRGRLRAVHRRMNTEEIASEMANAAIPEPDEADFGDDEDAYETALETHEEKLEALAEAMQGAFAGDDPLDDMAKATRLAPDPLEFKLIGMLDKPEKAHVYLFPKEVD